MIWCAGYAARRRRSWLGAPLTKQGTVPVAPDLSVIGHPEVFVAGILRMSGENGRPLPQIATVAKQQGAYVARVIAAPRRRVHPRRVRCVSQSRVAGDHRPLRRGGGFRLAAPHRIRRWLVWAFAHIFFLIGFRNRGAVFL